MSAPKLPCRNRACGNLVTNSGYCETCKPLFMFAKKPTYNHSYGPEYRRNRNKVFKLNDYLCVNCKANGRIAFATECDHIVPLSKGGTHKITNLRPLCRACHREKSEQERLEACRLNQSVRSEM